MKPVCSVCAETGRSIHARGMCKRCYSRDRYQATPELRARLATKQKIARISMSDEKIRARYAQQKDWERRNLERHRANKRAWNHRNGRAPMFAPGAVVWLLWNGFWCQGTVTEVSAPPKRRITVTLKGGTVHHTIGRYLKRTRPEVA